jgi:RNA polymerase sigma-70 factor (ECF subfamily)
MATIAAANVNNLNLNKVISSLTWSCAILSAQADTVSCRVIWLNTARGELIQTESEKTSVEVVRAGLPEVYPRLWRFALSLSGSRANADDLAQKTCARALEKAAQFDPGTHLDRWLLVMARRIWLNEIRANVVRRGNGLVAVEEIELLAENLPAETNIFAGEVFKAIGALPESQRETVMLVYVEGYAYKEAAGMLDIPIGTVMSRLAAARKAIARVFPEGTR